MIIQDLGLLNQLSLKVQRVANMGKFLLLVIFMACCALGSSTVEIKTSVLQNRGAISPRLQNPFLSTSALHCEGCGVDDAPGSPVNCEAEFFPSKCSRAEGRETIVVEN